MQEQQLESGAQMADPIARQAALAAFLPADRLHAAARGEVLPDRAEGAALLADISGFTRLADELVRALGPQRGAEALSVHLNRVYGALLAVVEGYQGSVIGFSGDAITCWFDHPRHGALRAATAAWEMVEAMRPHRAIEVTRWRSLGLSLKVAVAAGAARRFRVGDPSIQFLDALAGVTLERLAEAERLAEPDEVVLDEAAVLAVGGACVTKVWRVDGSGRRYAVVGAIAAAEPAPWPPLPADAVSEAELRPWVLAAVHERLGGRSDLFTELRPATALFLKFGGIDYDGDEAAGRALDEWVCRVQRVVVAYGGTLVDITIGDKGSYIYVAFGAPTAHEDDPRRAVAAALDLMAMHAATAIDQLQIGISVGRMRAGLLGAGSRRTYGVTGDEVNFAARLMSAAGPGQILVSERVAAACGGEFELNALEPITVKGKPDPVRVFAVRARRSAARLHEPRYKGPMVGRERELGFLEERLERALSGKGQVVGVRAAAGMGKSRLLAALMQRAAARGCGVFAGACQSFDTQTAYAAWREVWRGMLELDEGAPVAGPVQVQRLRDRLGSAAPLAALFGPLLNLDIAESDMTRQMEAQRRKESLEALLVDLVRERSAREPLVVVVDDAQWLDGLSLDLLGALAAALVSMPVLLVVAYRPLEQALPVVDLPHFAEQALGELTSEDVAQLVAHRLARHPGSRLAPALAELAAARSEGNPFFAEELLSYLEEQEIDPDDALALDRLEVPGSLASLILGRIDRLTAEQRLVLKVASVVGRVFRFSWLWWVDPAIGSEDRVRATLDELARSGLTPVDEGEGELTFLFNHATTQEVAYESLSFETRERLHEALAVSLEKKEATPPIDLLAFHYGRSANTDKKRAYFRRAGELAAARYANGAAIEHYERLLGVAAPAERGRILAALGGLYHRISRWDTAEARYASALEVVEGEANGVLRAQASLGIGALHRQRAAYEEAHAWIERARCGYGEAGDALGEVQALMELGGVYRLQGRLAEAAAVLHEGLELLPEGADEVAARAYHLLGSVEISKPDFDAAIGWWGRGLALRRGNGDKVGVAQLLGNVATATFLRGDLDGAEGFLAEARTICLETGLRWEYVRVSQLLALIRTARGDLTGAGALHVENLRRLRELGSAADVAESLAALVLAVWGGGSEAAGAACAAQLAGAAAAIMRGIGSPMPPFFRQQHERVLAGARGVLGEEGLAAALGRGESLGWREAVEYALPVASGLTVGSAASSESES